MTKPSTDWTTVKLREVGEALIGLTYDPSSVKRVGTLVLRSSNIQDDALVLDDNVYVDSDVPERIRVQNGDILLCVRNGSRRLIGKSTVLDERVVGQTFGAFMAVFRSNANAYLRFFFQSDAFRRQIDEHLGATINQITNGSLNSFTLSLPPKDEREAITRRLADADDLISALSRLIVKKQALKQGMAQELLSGRTRLPGSRGAWTEFQLDDLGVFLKGRGIKRDDLRPSGVPCIRYGELYTTFNNYTYVAVSRVAPEVAQTALPLQEGDLLFAGSGETREEIGTCVAFVGKEATVAGGDIIVLRSTRCSPVYLGILLNTPAVAEQKARLGQGDAVVHISSRALGSVTVTLPPRSEQDEIARALTDAQREIDALQSRLKKAKAIKQGIAQQLLTGRIRLPAGEAIA